MKPSSNSPDILDRLRSETKDAHTSVEQKSNAGEILNHTITAEGYEAFLQQNYRAYAEVEQQLTYFCDSPAVANAFFKPTISSWIAKDLGFEPTSLASSITLDNRFECLGAIYVMEGSLLGGTLLAKHLDSCENLSHKNTRHFHTSEVSNRGKRWKKFRNHLSRLSLSRANDNAVVKGAEKAFKIFEYHFDHQTIPKIVEA